MQSKRLIDVVRAAVTAIVIIMVLTGCSATAPRQTDVADADMVIPKLLKQLDALAASGAGTRDQVMIALDNDTEFDITFKIMSTCARAGYHDLTFAAGTLMIDAEYAAVKTVNVGDTLFTATNPRLDIHVTDVDEFETRPLSAFDNLMIHLMVIKEQLAAGRYGNNVADGDDIIIAPDSKVPHDKVTKIMDVARAAGFPNISLARLRE